VYYNQNTQQIEPYQQNGMSNQTKAIIGGVTAGIVVVAGTVTAVVLSIKKSKAKGKLKKAE
jgi:hypothetical protein